MSKTYIDRCADQALEHIDTIEAMLSIGHTRTASAKAVGMKPTDLHNVVREGKSKRGKCHDILITVLKAEGRAQVRLETIVIRDAEVNVDYNRLDQEEVKLKLLEEKLRLLREKSGESMSSDDWRAIMDEAKQAKDRIKSVH